MKVKEVPQVFCSSQKDLKDIEVTPQQTLVPESPMLTDSENNFNILPFCWRSGGAAA